MNAILAAVLVFSCESSDYEPRNAMVIHDPHITLARIEPRRARELRTLDFGAFGEHGIERLRVHARETVDLVSPEPIARLQLILEIRRAERTEWWELRRREIDAVARIGRDDDHFLERSGDFRDRSGVNAYPRLPPVMLVDRRLPLLRVEQRYEWLAGRGGGLVDFTLLIDLRKRPYDLMLFRCAVEWFGGRCGGGWPMPTMTCEWRGSASDFRCHARQLLRLGWTYRSASRTFWLMRDETILPARFDAVTHPSGSAFAQAVAADRGALKRRVLIHRIGIVDPIFELSPNEIVFAAPAREAGLGARFFLLRTEPARWLELDVSRLAGAHYAAHRDQEDSRAAFSADYTPDAPQILWTAVDLEPIIPPRKLIEVVMTEGEARAVFWLMFDRGRHEALRVAVTHPELRECGEQIHPPTALWLGVPDHGLPAYIQALPSFRRVEGAFVKIPPLFCWLTGTIDWDRRKGFIITLREAPCSNPLRDPYEVEVGANGELVLSKLDRNDR